MHFLVLAQYDDLDVSVPEYWDLDTSIKLCWCLFLSIPLLFNYWDYFCPFTLACQTPGLALGDMLI